MFEKGKYTSLLAFLLITIPMVWSSCSFMGKQPPVWEGGSFTPDGRYYAYLYSVYNVRNYERQGGYTRTSGPTDFYFQVIDCATGQKMLQNPIHTRKRMELGTIDNSYVWLTSFVPGDQEYGILVFDIGKMELTFDDDQISNLNPNIPLTHISFFENSSGRPGAVFEAADGRHYAVDGATGLFTQVEVEPWTRLARGDEDFYQYTSALEGIRLEGTSRKRLVKTDSTAKPSDDDFISPEFLAVERRSPYYL